VAPAHSATHSVAGGSHRQGFLAKEGETKSGDFLLRQLAWHERKDKSVPVPETLQKEMIIMRNEPGLNQYKFSFE
jgi:hypothetical protein